MSSEGGGSYREEALSLGVLATAMSKVHRVRRLALGCALALVGAAFAPGPPLCLLDWVVVHAHRAEGPLLVEAGLAAELQRLRPADQPTEVRRAELEAWLYTAGAALTSTPSGGWIVYRPGSVLARALLQRQAPWVEVAAWVFDERFKQERLFKLL